MGIRSVTTFAAAVTTAVLAAPLGHTASSEAPVSVEIGKVRCTQSVLGITPQGGALAMVPVTVRASAGSPTVPYRIEVNGQQKSTGSASGGGTARVTVTLPNNKESRVAVLSGEEVLKERTITARC